MHVDVKLSLDDEGTIESRFNALDEETKTSLLTDARHLAQRWYALTGVKNLNFVSDIK